MNENKIIIFIIMAITLVFALGRHSSHNKLRCIQLVTVILTCFSGFRSWNMGDVNHYCYVYIECNSPGWQLDTTIMGDTAGLQLFLRLFGQLGLSFEVCLFVIAAFCAIILGILVYKYSPSPYWSYTIYIAMGFYVSSFNMLKQIIAMTFVMLAMMCIFERKPLSFLVWTLIGALFHTPALIFLIAYPFANKKIDHIYFLLVAAMAVAVFLYRDEIVRLGTEIYYVDNMEFTAQEVIGGRVVVMLLILFLALFLRPIHRYDSIYTKLFNIMILAALVQTFSVYDNVFTRLADYFYQFIVLFIPLMLEPSSSQAKQYPSQIQHIRYWSPKFMFLIQMGITAFSIYFYISNVNASYALLGDFRFFWNSTAPSSLELLARALGQSYPY